ncbi:MAG: hypothetical protein HUJ53_01260 [Holdemanella sp.]|nr:hypothetical protein [Holdemanella sp.]
MFKKEYAPTLADLQFGIIASLLTIAITGLIIWFDAKTTCLVLIPMKEGLPFDKEGPKQIRKSGWIVIIEGIIVQICDVVSNAFLTYGYKDYLSALASSSLLERVEMNYQRLSVYPTSIYPK